MPTPTMEDYIEQIYILMKTKGYARVSAIAEALQVQPSSVTKMVQKLDRDDYLNYEKYQGLILTDKGKKIGERLVYRHELLEKFLEIAGISQSDIYKEVEGIEHHLSWDSIDRIGELVEFLEQPEQKENLQKFQAAKRNSNKK
ncbi:transcriptional regulator MntR [Gracilibacillus alcaliphilus]|uniref:transcriptional regulator MntR n=1 Tax=Gracilibacillus alcaliphilus TaxID=1401441 RepID=UPI001959594A|nr:transcriptional regulator MntR [Gracilibacillus alcaliphilus]MBM7675046.1 Mn-dependent DtxR family transcriptional regulator [Gracilibacillus alcaliphilus]